MTPANAAPDKPLILIVDDVPANVHVLASALRDDYRIKVALDGETALQIALRANDAPDLILLDVMMPRMSGHQVLGRLREIPETRDIPVVFITADTSQGRELQGLRLGAMDFLAKPVDIPVLRARVANLLEQRSLQNQLLRSDMKLRAMLDTSLQFIGLLDTAGRVLHLNRRINELLGMPLESSVGAHFCDIAMWSHDDRQRDEVRSAVAQAALGVASRFDTQHANPEPNATGEGLILDFSIRPVFGTNGEVEFLLPEASDVTRQKAAEEQIRHLANNDPLTNLPNRTLLADRVNQAIRSAERSQVPFALMFVDLDRFKHINDTLGHAAGDKVLREVGRRLVDSVRLPDTVARIGGDEFMLLLPETTAAGAAVVAQKLLANIAQPCAVDSHDLTVTPSIGIAMYPADGAEFSLLSRHADIAMYRAKSSGRNTFGFYTREMHERSSRLLKMEALLHQAIARNELSLHYQPQIDLETGECIGVEALLRWTSAELGPVSPAEFIPVAEETGLILPIGQWVMRTATCQARQWLDEGLPMKSMAVNVSSVQLHRPDFARAVVDCLRAADLPAKHLELELTETAAFSHAEAALVMLERLRDCGVRISIDDFGTGYSSLSYLKRIHIDKLKIDQSFVRDLGTHGEDETLVETMIHMAHSLRLTIVAEGVETQEQLDYLRKHRCDEVQGYFFSRPLPATEFEAWVRKRMSATEVVAHAA